MLIVFSLHGIDPNFLDENFWFSNLFSGGKVIPVYLNRHPIYYIIILGLGLRLSKGVPKLVQVIAKPRFIRL